MKYTLYFMKSRSKEPRCTQAESWNTDLWREIWGFSLERERAALEELRFPVKCVGQWRAIPVFLERTRLRVCIVVCGGITSESCIKKINQSINKQILKTGVKFEFSKKMILRSWRNSSVVKSNCCSSRGLDFPSIHAGHSQPPLIPSSGDLCL